ncbi:MAG: ISNCY family transposase [Chloroflexota bacterium]
MLIDRYPREDVFARVPELAGQTDPVLRQLDPLLDDDPLFQLVRTDLLHRYPHTADHGRHSTPAEAILRLLVVQHLFKWSFAETERRVADSLVLRWCCRVYFHRVPDGTTLLRWGHTIQPATLAALLDRVVVLATQVQVTKGRKLRLDGTVVESIIHHPTDSSLLTDGVRVLSRAIRRSKPLVGERLRGVRDAFRTRLRTMRRGLQTLHRLTRQKGEAVAEARTTIYRKLVETARKTVRQAQRVRQALRAAGEQAGAAGQRLAAQVDHFLPLVQQAIRQAERRVLQGEKVPAGEKVVSLFEPRTRIIPRHKGGAAVEFGRLVVFDEVEGGIITRFEVLADKTAEQGQLAPALAHHQRVFGHPPRLATGDRGTHAAENERVAQEAGVSHLVIPRAGPVSPAQRAHEQERGWRRRYHWRAGIEGRISSLRRDYGLRRCPAHGEDGLLRHIGWGVLASNPRHIGRHLAPA